MKDGVCWQGMLLVAKGLYLGYLIGIEVTPAQQYQKATRKFNAAIKRFRGAGFSTNQRTLILTPSGAEPAAFHF